MLFKSFTENILILLGGITVFLNALKLMSDNMQAVAGERMKRLLVGATGSRLRGVAVGAAATAVIQSSTATSMMLVGFVNAGILGLGQAITVVMGANIGTTITAQLVSLSGTNAFNVTAVASLVAFVGFFLGFSHRETARRVGNILFGFGTLFIGLEIMNGAIYAFRDLAFFRRLFMADNPLILVFNGILITGIVQSSSAVSSVMIILASNGLITFENSMFLILGTNIGAGIAVLLVSTAMSPEARRVAVANILFNVVGALLCFGPLVLFSCEIGHFFALISGGTERQIANFHTVFNLLVTAVLLPFAGPFERLVVLLTPVRKGGRGKRARFFGRSSRSRPCRTSARRG